jgi:hypothetical protein
VRRSVFNESNLTVVGVRNTSPVSASYRSAEMGHTRQKKVQTTLEFCNIIMIISL